MSAAMRPMPEIVDDLCIAENGIRYWSDAASVLADAIVTALREYRDVDELCREYVAATTARDTYAARFVRTLRAAAVDGWRDEVVRAALVTYAEQSGDRNGRYAVLRFDDLVTPRP